MAKIRVERKRHRRRAYLREDGVRVKSAMVEPSSFTTEDKGQPGKTPKEGRWFEPQVETGWRKDEVESIRRVKVLDAHKGEELASARAMQALSNVSTDRETTRKAKSDANDFCRIHR
jgi:hypothetical protein